MRYKDSQFNVAPLKAVVDEAENRHIEAVLVATGHNLQQTSRLLGIARNTLKAKMKLYRL